MIIHMQIICPRWKARLKQHGEYWKGKQKEYVEFYWNTSRGICYNEAGGGCTFHI